MSQPPVNFRIMSDKPKSNENEFNSAPVEAPEKAAPPKPKDDGKVAVKAVNGGKVVVRHAEGVFEINGTGRVPASVAADLALSKKVEVVG